MREAKPGTYFPLHRTLQMRGLRGNNWALYPNQRIDLRPVPRKRAAQKVAAFDGDTDYTDEITCPWCGNEQGGSWEHDDSCEHECDYCGKKYEHNREIEVHYSTSKIGS